jgi:glycosyltransferase involved in cell wall biosynthesis
MDRPIEVSVLCAAYNHENYIRNALEGFVSQKTNFGYEVLINDDLSTDGTAAIIREYEEKYPHIIKAVYQTENQYSKGISIVRGILAPMSSGKYIALCEGDDWWIDPNKLQKQYDYMQAHPECYVCTHNAIFHNAITGNDRLFTPCSIDKDYSVDEVICSPGGLFVTNSIFMRREVLTTLPSCFVAPGFGDYQLFVHGTICGTCHYLADTMSLYNYNTPGSWTSRIYSDKEKRIIHYQNLIHMLSNVNDYYEGKYSKPIQYEITKVEFLIHELNENTAEMKQEKYAPFYKEYKHNKRQQQMKLAIYHLYTFLEAHFPFVITLYHKLTHSED